MEGDGRQEVPGVNRDKLSLGECLLEESKSNNRKKIQTGENMNVELLRHSPMSIVINAIRKCYESEGNSDSTFVYDRPGFGGTYTLGPKDIDLVRRIVNSGHLSTIEHAVYTFEIDGISRGCLQEFARHRIASLSVKSTRYTLGRIKSEEPFRAGREDMERAGKYLVFTGEADIDYASMRHLEDVRLGAVAGIPNDKLKYSLPESFKTSLIWTINARSLRNFLELRLSERAHWEIRELAVAIINHIPTDHMILFNA